MLVERRSALLALASISALAPLNSLAQDAKVAAQTIAEFEKTMALPPELKENEYVKSLLQVINRWNQKQLKLPARNSLIPLFDARIDEQVAMQEFTYQTEDWGENAKADFRALPDTVIPEKPFEATAAIVLTLLYAMNVRSLKDIFGHPDALFKDETTLDEKMALPVFIVFGECQRLAATDKIKCDDVTSAVVPWWAKIWPFSVFSGK